MSKARVKTRSKDDLQENPITSASITFNKDISEEGAATIIANIASILPDGKIMVRYNRHSKSGRSSTKLLKGDQVEISFEPEAGVNVSSLGWSARRAQKFVDNITSIAAASKPVRVKLLDIITLGIAGVPLSLASEDGQLFSVSYS